MAEEKHLDDVGYLTQNLHVLPYFHGNRLPRANASLTGVVAGLRLSFPIDDLALHFLATLQAIAYGTRHIIENMNRSGYDIRQIFVNRGGSKNKTFLKS